MLEVRADPIGIEAQAASLPEHESDDEVDAALVLPVIFHGSVIYDGLGPGRWAHSEESGPP